MTEPAATITAAELLAEVDSTIETVKERIAIREELPAESFIDWAPGFLAATDPPIEYLVNELLPSGVIALLHGEPRTRKTWAALDIAIAVAVGQPAFGLSRFRCERPARTLYLSQEDGARLVRMRARALLRGRGVDCPENLAFAVHKGINLESAEWHERLIQDVRAHSIRLIVFDPIRRFAVNADKGPAEVRTITAYLRRLCTETGVTVLIVHHDVKPPASGQDTRRRGHRASGGDWFASAECPISFEAAGETGTIAYPESFKLSADPEPFTFKLKTDDLRNPTIAQLISETATSTEAGLLAIDEAVLAYIAANPGSSGKAIMKALQKGGETVTASLDRLLEAGRLDYVEGKRNAKLWTVPTVPERSEP